MNLLLFHLQTLFILLLLPRRCLSQIPDLLSSMNYLSRLYLHFIRQIVFCHSQPPHTVFKLLVYLVCSTHPFTPTRLGGVPWRQRTVLPISVSRFYTLCISAAIRIMSTHSMY